MSDLDVERAAARYGGGDSLKVVAAHFAVDPSTLAREFRRAGAQHCPQTRLMDLVVESTLTGNPDLALQAVVEDPCSPPDGSPAAAAGN